ncbi:MAG: FitA-like ribbon-helix-helix domain-containing protein [Cyanobium sp.]|jgi:plasmid stability protein
MATLTLRNVPDDLVARLKARAKRHRRSLNNETIAALELADAAASGATPQPAAEPVDIEPTLRRMQEISAGLRAQAAAEGREIRQVPPLPEMTEEEKAAERELFARLRSQFKGPPLTSEEIIAAIERDSHPPELDRFGYRINSDS